MTVKPDLLSSKAPPRALVIWCIATVIGSCSGIAAWTFHIDGFVRIIAEMTYLASLPGWMIAHLFGFSSVRENPSTIIAANAIAWLCWITLVFIIIRIKTRLDHPRVQDQNQSDLGPSRRAFLFKSAVGVTSIGAIATPGYATLIEPWTIKVRRYTIPINNLDPALENLKIVQLADTHLGPLIPASFIKQAVELVTDQNPDLVILTGDHVQDGTNHNQNAAKLCRPLVDQASIGVVGVLGNHDWWGDGHHMSNALSDHGVHMIDNDRIWIDAASRTIKFSDPGQGALAIVGFGDLTDDHIDPDRAFRGVADQTPRIVLSHNPDSAELSSLTKPGSPRIDLMCSGHTHGGQVKIPIIGTPIVPSNFGSKYAGGLVNGPAFPVHISRGVGMSLLPIRVGVPPEISVITLTRA